MNMKTIVAVLAGLLCGRASQRREDYLKAHPDIAIETRNFIASGRIVLGMTPDEVVASWGRPDHINTSVGAWGVHEQWVYGGCSKLGCKKEYLYFQNSRLTSWQQ